MRVRKRLGLKRKAVPQFVDNAIQKGQPLKEANGKLKRWFDRQQIKYKSGNNSIIYRGYVLVIQGNKLITVYYADKGLHFD